MSYQNTLETGGCSKAFDTTRQFRDTRYIDNPRRKLKKIRQPDGHNFKAVQVLQISFKNENKLFFDYNDSSDVFPDFQMSEVLNNSNIDINDFIRKFSNVSRYCY